MRCSRLPIILRDKTMKNEKGLKVKGQGSRRLVKLLVVAIYCLLVSVVSTQASLDIEEALKTHLRKHYPWVEIEIDSLQLNGQVPEELPVKIIVEKGLPGRTIFSLEFGNGKKITAAANVRAYDQVVISRRALRKGYTIKEEDVYTTLMDIRQIPGGAIKETEEVVGRQLNRSISANLPVTDNMADEKSLLKKGHRVVLVIEAPGFSITSRGEIKEDGHIGSLVKAVNIASKKVVTGILLDEHTVRVEF